ncbi:MAG: hypothetical protein E7246_09380 [Lachnoclostridium sp.]|nr:hypothetical protein [Lachnoclostridium sp.]
MAKHEFGIMQNAPKPGERYDEYEPQKYLCISVDDNYVEKQAFIAVIKDIAELNVDFIEQIK